VKGILQGKEKSRGKEAGWNKNTCTRGCADVGERRVLGGSAGREELTGETDLYCAMCSSDVGRGIRT